jgi:XrtJ-associated TM-motif-TM protein
VFAVRKQWLCGLFLTSFVMASLPSYAQSGCVNSPENPTAILVLIGVAGVLYVARKK